eukprot:m.22547 g.22547  ORF g.22547 m.22547 type:complete len:157 (-) comp7410_c0_seq1:318-788(-)
MLVMATELQKLAENIQQAKTYYEVLDISKDADMATIRKKYLSLSLQFHPDKHHGDTKEMAEKVIQVINNAWSVLKDEDARKLYDQNQMNHKEGFPLQEDVDLDDMIFNDGKYYWSCRCGGEYSLTENDLEKGTEYYGCSSCTLCIHVLFELDEGDT